MSAERIENLLDLTAWVFGGLLFGFLVLGAYNGYREYRNPSIPSVDLKPLDESDVQPEPDRSSFQPLEEFHLVRTLSPQQTDEETSPEQTEESTDTEPERATQDLPTTSLPYRLLGTTTGAPRYTSAVIQHKGKRETRTLGEGESWEDLRVLSIRDDFVLIRNLTNNQRERLPFDERSSSGV